MATLRTSTAARIARDVQMHRVELLKLARQYGAKDVRLFGSVARGEARRASDIDVLVTMERGRTLTDMAALKRTFTKTLRRHVDVVSTSGMSPYLRTRILKEAQPL